MTPQRLLALCTLCAILCLIFGSVVLPAHAQDSDAAKSFDKEQAQKRTVGDSLADGDEQDDGDGPTALQMSIGVGSVIVAFIVWKWL